MLKTKMKSALMAVLAVAMIACIALGYAFANRADLAYANAAESPAAAQTVVTTVTVSADNPANIQLSGYAAGQYYLTASVTNEDLPDDFYSEFIVTVDKDPDDAEAYYLTYNSETKVAAGVIKTASDNQTVELSVTTSTEITVEVSVDALYIGPSINNSLGVVEISQTPLTIQLKDVVTGDYDINVELAEVRITANTLTIRSYDANGRWVGRENGYTNGTPVRNEDNDNIIYYPFTGVSLAAGGYITITSDEVLDVTVTIQNAAPDKLPLGEGIPLTPWELVTYSYTVAADGVYVISYEAPADADVSITFKTDAASYDGLLVQGSNYPLTMSVEDTYYFDIVLTSDNNATVTFHIEPWVTPTVKVGELYYLPATIDGSQEMSPLEIEAGTYTLTLTDIPADVIWNEREITAIFASGKSVSFNLANNFVANVEITAADTWMFLMTTNEENITVGVTFSIPEERNEITEGTPVTVTIPGKVGDDDFGSVIYYLTNPVERGFYTLTLSDVSAPDVVSVITSEGVAPFINEGGVVGGFRVNYVNDFALIFRNSGSDAVTLNAVVHNVAGENAIALKTTTSIEIGPSATAAKYLEGLVQGSYDLTFSNAAGISVYEDGVKLDIADNKAVITVDYLQAYNGIVSLVFVNDTAAAVTFDVTVAPQNEMALDTPVTISAHGYETVVSYYIDIANGNYAMALKVPEGLSVNVVLGGYEVIAYGNVAGVVTIDIAHDEDDESINPVQGYLSVIFYCYGNEEVDYSLSAVLYKAEETPMMDEQPISLGTSKFAATYSIELSAGEYSVNLYEGVTVAVNGVPVGADGTFLITDYSTTAYITFINTTDAAISGYTAAVKLEQTHIATLDHGMGVTLVPYVEGIYYIDLAEGDYNITLVPHAGDNLENVYIYIDGIQVTLNGEGIGTFHVDAQSAPMIAFYYYGEAESVSFTFTVTAATAE